MLILYCQQFAFAPTMVSQCAALLTCRQRKLPYFWGKVSVLAENFHHDVFVGQANEPKSSAYDPKAHGDVHIQKPLIEKNLHGAQDTFQKGNHDEGVQQADFH